MGLIETGEGGCFGVVMWVCSEVGTGDGKDGVDCGGRDGRRCWGLEVGGVGWRLRERSRR